MASNDVTVIDCATNAVVATVAVGAGPDAMVHNPNQGRVYVANSADSSVSVLRDTTGGVGTAEYGEAEFGGRAATVVRGVFFLRQSVAAALLDISGRSVMDLEPGANGVSSLAPGIYFVLAGLTAVAARLVKVE